MKNYVCYNIYDVKHGLAVFEGSDDSESFDAEARALWIQRMALLKPEPAWQIRR